MRKVVGLLVVSGLLVAGVRAQDAPVFRSSIDLVPLSVVVTDGEQRFVRGLSAEDFSVFEDGVQQDVSFFASSAVPIDLAILLDTSASMTDKMDTVQEAAAGFASRVSAGDRITIVDIKDSVRTLYPLGEDLTSARAAIRATTAGGGTALYNGLYTTMKEIMKQRRTNGEVRREAIVVLSDGDDTASLVTSDDVMEVAKQAGIPIYPIVLKSAASVRQAHASGRRAFSQSEFAMRTLAKESGARVLFATDVSELAAAYDVVAEELASQYALGYTPKNGRADGKFRHLVVRVAQPGAQTRTRSGYMAPRAQRGQSLPLNNN
jgi:Ca-activated chloride channel family protein